MNSGSEEHLAQRNSRYSINSQRDSFKTNLKGLTVIELCITELCTRKCGFCPRADSENYPNQKLFMSTETITNICDSCKEHNYEGDFHISGFGESYTHKQFFEIVKTLRSILPGNRVTVTSNGDLLSSDKIKTTYESGVDYMIISCYDGETARDKFVDMFTQAGIADNDYEIRELWLLPGETVDQMMDRNQFNNRSGAVVVEEYRHEFVENACYLPFYKLVIDWDGTVLLCCNDWYRRHKGFGNINEISIKDIWLGSEFQKVRKNFHSGKRTGSACSNCNVNGTLVGHESVDVLMDQ